MTRNINTKQRIIITAGPTIEGIDPVRYLSNRSTGTMGYLMAEEAVKSGYEVVLITGPVSIPLPEDVEAVSVETASEMEEAVKKRIRTGDCIIMAAAVCDFRPVKKEEKKIKKAEKITLELEKNPDILLSIKDMNGLVRIGFALETENALSNGKAKLEGKGLDMIVINEVSGSRTPFGENERPGGYDYTILSKHGEEREFRGVTKRQLARTVIEMAGQTMGKG
ncbi:MAG: phosphopantothenoylcysteine decarboxylase [Candidatus Omnitrophica bacterium]|nr:phosphopantothenoylcysteine decarboxylase [Candidatus Omnitrophota bacterium]MDD5488326.1 phosphopantothenoylcysteine decarboxylase [Candidatus Omnitrophota bacterium]